MFIFFTSKRSSQIQVQSNMRRSLLDVNFEDEIPHVNVRLQDRIFSGRVLSVGSRKLHAFYGIPYAEPPVKDLRFKKPVPIRQHVSSDSTDDVIMAFRKNFPCPQRQPWNNPQEPSLDVNISEDCLHMNIWTPSDSSQQRTVLVFLHGGYFETGGNDRPFNDGQRLSAEGDVVVVVPNYRLNAFGFLKGHVPSAPGNVGVHDVLLSLQWVYHNIVHFGGSPEQIVLVGRDAGAVLAGYVMVSPLARGLVKRYILLSGSPFWILPSNRGFESLVNFKTLPQRMNCQRGDVVQMTRCLIRAEMYDYVNMNNMAQYRMLPSDEDELLPFPMPVGLTQSATYAARDVLLGSELDVGEALLHSSLRVSLDGVMNSTLRSFGSRILRTYGVPNPLAAMAAYDVFSAANRSVAMANLVGDFVVHCPLQFLADELSKRHRRVFYFVLERDPRWPRFGDAELDQSLLFGLPFELATSPKQMLKLSKKIIYAWTTFAKTGSTTGT
ncbi:acetylcholinesterase/butyrylcholinesterase, putative [Ixodes scapularis]|uniref:Acetylcholinesterase/butyrylcholinesterase, putative n=1 Tax=Ixodes scapularis TaxID=6945 RepID=B7PU15_IXOSC|nr:acetylcholinesterase/butyrylcholinesterase, putative [Ixodes scapularis]|eukprot:XP_002405247.1 acetylcholinesterase/butyrylcholinesterase, putative [Ixodes scapularis]